MRGTFVGGFVLAACLILPASQTHARQVASPAGAGVPPTAVPAPAAEPAKILLPANTVVELEMVDSVSSATSKPGDLFKLRVVLPVQFGNTVLIAANTPAVGQVVHAAKAGAGGKAGELILAARYLDLPGDQVKLRSTLGAAGAGRAGTSLGISLLAGPFAMMIKGRQVVLPTGTLLSARLAFDTVLPAAP